MALFGKTFDKGRVIPFLGAGTSVSGHDNVVRENDGLGGLPTGSELARQIGR